MVWPRAMRLLLAAGLAAGALMFPERLLSGFASQYRITGIYSSALAERCMSPERLQAIVSQADFVQAAGGGVRVARAPGLSQGFLLQAEALEEAEGRSLLHRSVELLEREVALVGAEELGSRLGYLRKIESTPERRVSERKGSIPPPESLSEQDAETAVRLREDIVSLEEYLAGGRLNLRLRTRLHGPAIGKLQQRAAGERRQLDKLKQIYRSEDEVVLAQRDLMASINRELRLTEVSLAKSLLASLRLEYRQMKTRSKDIVARNRRAFEAEVINRTSNSDTKLPGATWISDEILRLQQLESTLPDQARFRLRGGLEVLPPDPHSSWPQGLLWLAALAALYWSLQEIASPPPPIPGSGEKGVDSWVAGRNLSLKGLALGEQIRHGLETKLGRFPKRLLVLGSDQSELRALLSLHLARKLSDDAIQVRLLDFDFERKVLTRRILGLGQPGLAELIGNGGVIEEYFCSLKESRIQFAPSGLATEVGQDVHADALAGVARAGDQEVLLVDASFRSPLHLVLPWVDAVLCLSRQPQPWTEQEKEVLMALRDSQVTMWAVSSERPGLYPMI